MADRAENGRWLEGDLLEPVMLTAFQDSAPIWATLAIKGTAINRTPVGEYHILTQVLNETMDGETLHPPIARHGPGGYYFKNVLRTQYYNWTGETIHYNYRSSNWGTPDPTAASASATTRPGGRGTSPRSELRFESGANK
jgi:hypothetical protein